MAKDVRMDSGLQPGGVPVVLHNLLDTSYRVGAAALRLKDKAVGGVRREVRAQHEPKGVWKQEITVLPPFALVDKDLTGGQVDITHRNPHQFPDPYRGKKQQLQHNFMLYVFPVPHG